MQAHGKEKVLWGTNYPVVEHEQSLGQLEEFDFSEEVMQKVLHDNSARSSICNPAHRSRSNCVWTRVSM